jgi:2-polyprenyl-6-hydroxyphenyl methylase/3-demethylubiquinone-9 3-methyltransferase
MTMQSKGTVDAADIARFDNLARDWWDEAGPHGPLHRFTPIRMGLIRDRLTDHFKTDTPRPLGGLSVLDVGCGGGLLSEPMTRLGASVTGIDASAGGIAAAKAHAALTGLEIDYRHTDLEDLAESSAQFDAVVASEVVEHVADLDLFTQALASVLKPGGLVFLTTINRTAASMLLAKAAAEYVLGWVPRGTHDWDKFVTPDEISRAFAPHNVKTDAPVGLTYDPLAGHFRKATSCRVNYAICGVKAA